MRLPFVSLVMHREVCDALYRGLMSERENAQALRVENTELRVKYHELRMQGANPAVPKDVLPQRQWDQVLLAVNLACKGDKKLRAQMMAQVERDRAQGMDELKILDRIQRGNSDDSLESFVGGT